MYTEARDTGHECWFHDQCASGVCLPVDMAPFGPADAQVGVCALACEGEIDCPGDSWCQALGDPELDYSVCVWPH